MTVVEFRNVTKHFSLKKIESYSLFDRKQKIILKAVDNVSFEIKKGDIVGLVGLNGSGKSTLSDLIAEMSKPTYGKVFHQGSTSLLAINAGLKPNLSGVDNIKLKCLYHGIKEKEIEKIIPKIIKFSELNQFINQPIKLYSSGMKAKLGFSIAIHLNTDILVIDEALAVGDQTFYQKCLDKLLEKNKVGVTIIFVSHSMSQVRSLCNKVLWLDQGKLMKFGATEEVLEEFQLFIKNFNELSEIKKRKYKKKNEKKRFLSKKQILKRKLNCKWYSVVYISIIILAFIYNVYIILR
ncbi:ABC transporter ATP-binding protein [Enterococcus sp. AZ126]|uniref:ABC transporter ATP-binding protein n=1 Tax=Enterococcus sp. AZ126 TaxID=2774635 RepID=UPI003F1FFF50